MPLLRSRGRKSLATSGFAGAYLARQGIYTLSPETALLLRNKSTAKGVILILSILVDNITMNAALPFMDGETWGFAARTLAKVERMGEAEFAGLPIYAADEV